MADEDSPLIKALPPATDYLTYLTIIEYNLKPENLPLLHQILQDENLTINIGWDLVQILIAHLPHSEQCLQDIARLGNPREVILKVTEGLHLIDFDDSGNDGDDGEPTDQQESDLNLDKDQVHAKADSSTFPLKTAPQHHELPSSSQAVELPSPLPLPVTQFTALVAMLSVLQPRIKTKYPSRFLCTTLQAMLASFSKSTSHRHELLPAIVRAVKSFAGIQRPGLPARKSSGMSVAKALAAQVSAPDPEGSVHPETSKAEGIIQTKLLQAFVTHLCEEYLLNLTPYDDIPGMAWTSRIREKLLPERNIPGTKLLSTRFHDEEKLHHRIDAVGPLVALAKDLGITDQDLLTAATSTEQANLLENDPDELPNSADEIPLSRLGSLILFTARRVAGVLHDRPENTTNKIEIFPEHHTILQHCLSAPDPVAGTLGTEPEALIDSVLALGLHCIEHNAIGEPADDEQFNEFLQVTALLSANCPNANLRGHAQYLTSTVLRSHPDDRVRLAFIRDTLEHCPFDNLKVSAVGWIKGETVEANPPTPLSPHEHTHADSQHDEGKPERSIFSTALPLASLAPFLFPHLATELLTAPIEDAWMTFQSGLSFYFASLNFLFLLLSAQHLHNPLEIQDLWTSNEIAGNFLQPLRDAEARFKAELRDSGALAQDCSDAVKAELMLLAETVERVGKSAKVLE